MPNGAVRMTQWAFSLNETTPNSSRSVSAETARRIASLPMSTLGMPLICTPLSRSAVLQWQASIEPDWSMTTTSAMSGCFSLSRTSMSTGSDFLERRALVAAGAVRVGTTDHHQATTEIAREHLQRDHPLGPEPVGGDVGEHDRVVRRQAGQVGRHLLRRDDGHVLVLRLERRQQVFGGGIAAGDEQDARIALDDRV